MSETATCEYCGGTGWVNHTSAALGSWSSVCHACTPRSALASVVVAALTESLTKRAAAPPADFHGIVAPPAPRAPSDPRLALTDVELLEYAPRIISEMCEGDRWRMSVPVHRYDSDIVFSTLVERFRATLTEQADLNIRNRVLSEELVAAQRRLTEQDTLVAAARAASETLPHAKDCNLNALDYGETLGCTCALVALRAALPPSPADRTEEPRAE